MFIMMCLVKLFFLDKCLEDDLFPTKAKHLTSGRLRVLDLPHSLLVLFQVIDDDVKPFQATQSIGVISSTRGQNLSRSGLPGQSASTHDGKGRRR